MFDQAPSYIPYIPRAEERHAGGRRAGERQVNNQDWILNELRTQEPYALVSLAMIPGCPLRELFCDSNGKPVSKDIAMQKMNDQKLVVRVQNEFMLWVKETIGHPGFLEVMAEKRIADRFQQHSEGVRRLYIENVVRLVGELENGIGKAIVARTMNNLINSLRETGLPQPEQRNIRREIGESAFKPYLSIDSEGRRIIVWCIKPKDDDNYTVDLSDHIIAYLKQVQDWLGIPADAEKPYTFIIVPDEWSGRRFGGYQINSEIVIVLQPDMKNVIDAIPHELVHLLLVRQFERHPILPDFVEGIARAGEIALNAERVQKINEKLQQSENAAFQDIKNAEHHHVSHTMMAYKATEKKPSYQYSYDFSRVILALSHVYPTSAKQIIQSCYQYALQCRLVSGTIHFHGRYYGNHRDVLSTIIRLAILKGANLEERKQVQAKLQQNGIPKRKRFDADTEMEFIEALGYEVLVKEKRIRPS